MENKEKKCVNCQFYLHLFKHLQDMYCVNGKSPLCGNVMFDAEYCEYWLAKLD